MNKLDPRWFKEDRAISDKGAVEEAIASSAKVINNATFITRRLKQILEDDIEKTYRSDEDFNNPGYNRQAIANASARKTLRSIIKLLP